MLRMILWKEWREQRMLVLAGLGFSILTPLLIMASMAASPRGVDYGKVIEVLPALLLGVLWPCFLLGVGANTIATELGEGTLGFLLSRPVSRARLWSAKVLVAAASAGVVLVWIVAICWVSSSLAGRASLFDALLPGSGPFADFLMPGLIVGVGVSCLFYATAVFFSTVLSRTLTAAAAALATSLVVITGMVYLWSRLDLVPRLEPQWLALQLLLSGAAILGASFWLFSRGEMLRSRGPRAAACAALVLVGLPAAALPSVLAFTRLPAAAASLPELALSPSGSDVVATAARQDGGSPEIWSIAADGSGVTRLTGRLAMNPVVSPDGRLVAYVSLRGPLGLRSADASLRIARMDGGGDRLLAGGLTSLVHTRMVFSADGHHIAALLADTLVVAATDGSASFTCDLGADGRSSTWLMGLGPGTADALVLRAAQPRNDAAKLVAISAGSCAERVIHDLQAPADQACLLQPPHTGRYLPLVTLSTGESGSRGRQLSLIDLETRTVRLLADSDCHMPAGFSRDGKALVYVECILDVSDPFRWSPTPSAARSVIHRVTLPAGDDVRLGEIPGRVWSVLFSPSGERVALQMQRGETAMTDVVIEKDGAVAALEEGWTVIGWNGDNRLVLAERSSGDVAPRKLALAAAGTWEPLQFHPPAAASR